VWSEGKAFDFEIVYKNSTDSGLSWSASERITWNTGFSYFPAVASDPLNFIYVVWQDKAPGNYEIFHKSRK
jgi:hypothetical protein